MPTHTRALAKGGKNYIEFFAVTESGGNYTVGSSVFTLQTVSSTKFNRDSQEITVETEDFSTEMLAFIEAYHDITTASTADEEITLIDGTKIGGGTSSDVTKMLCVIDYGAEVSGKIIVSSALCNLSSVSEFEQKHGALQKTSLKLKMLKNTGSAVALTSKMNTATILDSTAVSTAAPAIASGVYYYMNHITKHA